MLVCGTNEGGVLQDGEQTRHSKVLAFDFSFRLERIVTLQYTGLHYTRSSYRLMSGDEHQPQLHVSCDVQVSHAVHVTRPTNRQSVADASALPGPQISLQASTHAPVHA